MSTALIRDLLDGSEVIDIQKKHIRTILHMLFWLVEPEEIHRAIRAAASAALAYGDPGGSMSANRAARASISSSTSLQVEEP